MVNEMNPVDSHEIGPHCACCQKRMDDLVRRVEALEARPSWTVNPAYPSFMYTSTGFEPAKIT